MGTSKCVKHEEERVKIDKYCVYTYISIDIQINVDKTGRDIDNMQ